jgi:hypothetical protein
MLSSEDRLMALSDRTHADVVTPAPAAAPQEISTPTCEECGTALGGAATRRSRQRSCSPRCRSRAYYREHRPVRLDKLDVDPVPLSPKEAAMMAASAEELARGDYLTHAELDALLAGDAVRRQRVLREWNARGTPVCSHILASWTTER